MDNPKDAKPLEMPPVLEHVQAAVNQLVASDVVKAAIEAVKRDDEKTLADQIAITEVEAPPFHEEVRAKDFVRRLEELGLKASIDEEGNVLARRSGKGNGPTLVLAAHLDTVFPAGTNPKVRREGNRYLAPGISVVARGLAAILQVLRTLQEFKIETVGDILFVGSVGEEGNGDLRGSKYLFNKSGIHIDGFISVDGVNVNRVLCGATGSKRYRVHYDGPGGHSWNAFGTPSAIHAIGRAIAKIADIQTVSDPKTTFTCGTIKGGTPVNTIAAHCEVDVDMRSVAMEDLMKVEETILAAFEEAVAEANARWTKAPESSYVKLTKTKIGDRPAGQRPAACPAVTAALEGAQALGIEVTWTGSSSTDCNLPMSLGIPAVCLGTGGHTYNEHSLKEYFDSTDMHLGPQLALLTVLGITGLA